MTTKSRWAIACAQVAAASVIILLLSVWLSWFANILSFILGLLAIVFGSISLKEIEKKKLRGKDMAYAGLILGSLMMELSILYMGGV